MRMISAAAFLAERAENPDLQVLDVRTPEEVETLRLTGKVLFIPLDALEIEAVRAKLSHPEEPLYILCRTDNRSAIAAQRLEAEGMENLVIVEGGMMACTSLGAEVV